MLINYEVSNDIACLSNFFSKPVNLNSEKRELTECYDDTNTKEDTEGFLYLGHSNWTICSLLS